jgi:hypothetical protein
MKVKLIIYALIALPMISFTQDTLNMKRKKSFFSIQVGVSYKTFLSNKYIDATPYNLGDDFASHQYERFNKIPTMGFNLGWLFTYQFNAHIGVTSGLVYSLKKDKFEANQDTIIKYASRTDMNNIHNVYHYNYSFNNIELPVIFQYSLNKFIFYGGFNIVLITYKKGKYSYVFTEDTYVNIWDTSSKTISGFETSFKFYPTVQAAYKTKINNLRLEPYIAIYYALKSQNNLYIQIGLNFPII